MKQAGTANAIAKAILMKKKTSGSVMKKKKAVYVMKKKPKRSKKVVMKKGRKALKKLRGRGPNGRFTRGQLLSLSLKPFLASIECSGAELLAAAQQIVRCESIFALGQFIELVSKEVNLNSHQDGSAGVGDIGNANVKPFVVLLTAGQKTAFKQSDVYCAAAEQNALKAAYRSVGQTRGTKKAVWNRTALKTVGGNDRTRLMKHARTGRVVSRAASEACRARYQGSLAQKWSRCVTAGYRAACANDEKEFKQKGLKPFLKNRGKVAAVRKAYMCVENGNGSPCGAVKSEAGAAADMNAEKY